MGEGKPCSCNGVDWRSWATDGDVDIFVYLQFSVHAFSARALPLCVLASFRIFGKNCGKTCTRVSWLTCGAASCRVSPAPLVTISLTNFSSFPHNHQTLHEFSVENYWNYCSTACICIIAMAGKRGAVIAGPSQIWPNYWWFSGNHGKSLRGMPTCTTIARHFLDNVSLSTIENDVLFKRKFNTITWL